METHAESGFIVVNRQLQTSRQNSKQSQGRQRGCRTHYCETSETSWEEEKLSLCVGSFEEEARRFPGEEKKLAGKPHSLSPEDQQDSVCVKELENTSLVCGSDRDLESSDNPTPAPAVEPDLLQERAVLFDFLAKTNIDSDNSEDNEVDCVCSNCKHPPKEGGELKRCSRCHITRYCSVQCQKKDWDFHRFACSVVAKMKSNA